uniref:Uncharacterized protein n=1 Tax=Romanomermis culicivorax TaxID=13658 RepID=A0A915IFR5_ROMCU
MGEKHKPSTPTHWDEKKKTAWWEATSGEYKSGRRGTRLVHKTYNNNNKNKNNRERERDQGTRTAVCYTHQHTTPYGWEGEAGHYDRSDTKTCTGRPRRKGQRMAQVGACGGRTLQVVLLPGLSVSCTCAG